MILSFGTMLMYWSICESGNQLSFDQEWVLVSNVLCVSRHQLKPFFSFLCPVDLSCNVVF